LDDKGWDKGKKRMDVETKNKVSGLGDILMR
jgi:hypothetical protein